MGCRDYMFTLNWQIGRFEAGLKALIYGYHTTDITVRLAAFAKATATKKPGHYVDARLKSRPTEASAANSLSPSPAPASRWIRVHFLHVEHTLLRRNTQDHELEIDRARISECVRIVQL